MALVIVIVVIVLIVLTLYDRLQPHLPKELRLNKDAPNGALIAPAPTYGPQLPLSSPNRWLVTMDGMNTRAVREFRTPIRAPGGTYDAPLLYFSCYSNHLYSWLDTRLRAAAAATDSHFATVQVDAEIPELWARQRDQTLIPPDPGKLLRRVAHHSELRITLAFEEAPRQSLVLDLKGTNPLLQAVGHCLK